MNIIKSGYTVKDKYGYYLGGVSKALFLPLITFHPVTHIKLFDSINEAREYCFSGNRIVNIEILEDDPEFQIQFTGKELQNY